MSFDTFGFGKGDDNIISTSKAYKGKKDNTDRVSFCWWPIKEDGKLDLEADTPKFIGAKRGYRDGVGYFLVKGPEYAKLADGKPKTQVATLLVIWPTDDKGKLNIDAFKRGEFEVKPWVFSQDKYRSLAGIAEEWPFAEHDIKMKCLDTQYQKMEFNNLKDSCLKKVFDGDTDTHKMMQNKILAAIEELAPDLGSVICRDYDIQELHEKIYGESASSSGGGYTGNNTPGDIDGEVDDILGDL
ncbi:MAG: hypothetical protein AAGM67_02365 [Bacteroidota bacterium]